MPSINEKLQLPDDAVQALTLIREVSEQNPVVVFKKSPICPVSKKAEARFRAWVKGLPADLTLGVHLMDVIGWRKLSRDIVAELGLQHESPQALWFENGQCVWNASHEALTAEAFNARLKISKQNMKPKGE